LAEDRRDDWHNSVDARLVNLTSAQKSADIDLERLKDETAEMDKILRGERKTRGLIEAVNHLENEVNKFNRIFLDKDYAGYQGLPAFLTYLYNQEKSRNEDRQALSGYRWGFWGLILAAAIGAAAMVFTNKDQIEKWWPHKMSPFDQMIERAAHPKSRHRHYTIRIEPDGTESTKEN
jgi:hypothetical protein